MSTVIEIDTLVLEGMTDGDARRAAGAFERQLQYLLNLYGLPPGKTTSDLDGIDLGSLPVTMTTPEARGGELARALFAELLK